MTDKEDLEFLDPYYERSTSATTVTPSALGEDPLSMLSLYSSAH